MTGLYRRVEPVMYRLNELQTKNTELNVLR